MLSILVVDKRESRAKSTAADLLRQGHRVHFVSSGQDALRQHRSADLILLNLELPDIDGLKVCQVIRTTSESMIIALTEDDTELNRVLALQAGADDCVMSTCGSREIMARIDAVTRRSHRHRSTVRDIVHSRLHIKGKAREVRVDGRLVRLTAMEFDLLYALASSPESVLSRKELMAKIWNDDRAEPSRTIDTHVSNIRTKLGSGEFIAAVRGVGYRIGNV